MSLHTTFEAVCALYFPRWRAAPTWTIREGPRAQWQVGTQTRTTTEMGYCDHATKTIWINARPVDHPLILIHEICHAICSGGHATLWQRRMGQAQARAVTQGDTALAEALAAEIAGYAADNALLMTAGTVYARVEEMLLDTPQATLDYIVEAIGGAFSMTPAEMLHRYARLPYWYARHRREQAAVARAQLQATTMRGLGGPLADDLKRRLAALSTSEEPRRG
jgi:hypothetical protein